MLKINTIRPVVNKTVYLILGLLLLNHVEANTPYQTCRDEIKAPLQVWSSGWSKDYQQQRSYKATDTGLKAEDLPQLDIAWSFVFKDTVRPRSLPAITKQVLYLGSEEGRVFALNTHSGCGYWAFQAKAEVRTAISIAAVEIKNGQKRWLLFFADIQAHAYAIDAITGELVWSKKMDSHPEAVITGSPVFYQGRLFVPVSSLEVKQALKPYYNCCTFRGSLVSLNAATGEEQWRFYPLAETAKPTHTNLFFVQQYGPSGVAIWSAPTIDEKRQRLYFGTGQHYSSPTTSASDAIFALDLHTGKKLWSRQFLPNDAWNAACTNFFVSANCPKENGQDADFGAPPILISNTAGKDILIAGQKNAFVYALDPDANGDELWRINLGRGGLLGGIHWGMAADSQAVYAPVSDINIFPAPTPAGRRQPGLNKLDINSGKRLWSTNAFKYCPDEEECRQGLSAAITAIPGAILAPALDGILRAYDKTNGQVIWQFDSTQTTVGSNQLSGNGGTLDAGGVIASHGHLFFNSGYGGFTSAGGTAGNVFWVLRKKTQTDP